MLVFVNNNSNVFSYSGESKSIEVVSRLYAEGPGHTVFVQDNYAYLGAGSTLVVLDVTIPEKPVKKGSVLTPGLVRGIYVSGNYAYVADGDDGLRIFNIVNPSQPGEVGYYDSSGFAQKVFVSGGMAYLADDSVLRLIDVSNPANPQETKSVEINAQDVYLSGNYLYVVGSDKLRVVDVSNSANPLEVGSLEITPKEGNAVFVLNNYAYVATGQCLQVVNISDPANPQKMGIYTSIDWNVRDVNVSGHYAYVAGEQWEGLSVIDVSNPNIPRKITNCWTHGDTWGVFVSGNLAYTACEGTGLRVFDISKPAKTHEIGNYDTPARTHSVYVAGDYAYVNTSSDGLIVVDVSNPASPKEVTSLDTPDRGIAIYISRELAYLADLAGGLRILNISNPLNPVEIGAIPQENNGGGIRANGGIHVSAGFAYLTEERGDLLKIVDVNNPTKPFEVSAVDTPGKVRDVFVTEDVAYVADENAGLTILDVSNPENPQELSTIDTPGDAYGVYISDVFAYVADGNSLRIIDVSDSAAPAEIGNLNMSAGVVFVDGEFAYVAGGGHGFYVVWIKDPTAPKKLGFFDTPDSADNVFVFGEYIYLIDRNGGMYILRYKGKPDDPTGLSAKTLSSNQVALNWQDNSDNEDGFKIERSLSSDSGFIEVGSTAEDINSYTETGLAPSVIYYYRVRAYHGPDYSGYTNTVSAKTLPKKGKGRR